MARVLYGKQALVGLEQLIDALAQQDRKQAFAVTDAIAEAIGKLEQRPLNGTPLPGGLRQLHITRGDSVLLALYRYLALEDRVEILSLQPHRA
ncbi:MAG TPA: type II toxin-antitoxin system RelE/ParE family toxin [Gallionellaceae bacterium]